MNDLLNHQCPGHIPCPPPFQPKPMPHPAPFPNPCTKLIGSSVTSNIMMLVDGNPYIYDQSKMTMGVPINLATDVENRIVSRPGSTNGLYLDAKFDLTSQFTPNDSWVNFIEQKISIDHAALEGILPMIKSCVTFRIYYTIKDLAGDVVSTSYGLASCQSGYINPCEIDNVVINSFKNIITIEVHDLPYQGLFTLTIDRIDAVVDTVDIKPLILIDTPNQFYSFTENNSHIRVNSEALQATASTPMVIATNTVNKSFQFNAAASAKIKMSFTAITNMMVIVGNTLGIWTALNSPSPVQIEELADAIEELNETVTQLSVRVSELETKLLPIVAYHQNIRVYRGQIVFITVGQLYQANIDFITDATGGKSLQESFEIDVAAGKLISCTV